MTEWFRRKSKNIKTFDKRDTLEGSWIKCSKCTEMIYRKVLKKNNYVCQNCNYHYRHANMQKYHQLKVSLIYNYAFYAIHL